MRALKKASGCASVLDWAVLAGWSKLPGAGACYVHRAVTLATPKKSRCAAGFSNSCVPNGLNQAASFQNDNQQNQNHNKHNDGSHAPVLLGLVADTL